MNLTKASVRRISLALLSFLFVSIHSYGQTNVVPDNIELAVLKNFYDSLGGSGWTTKTNWPTLATWPSSATSSQFDTWHGITVENGDITQINLESNNLTGQLPSSLSSLVKLKVLYLKSNQIGGSIPASYTALTDLINLSMHYNQLTGTIPADIGSLTNLTVLNFHDNDLTGSIPESIGNLTKVKDLHLSNNQLTGEIPTTIGNLVNLENLYLRFNQLSGALPDTMGSLTKVRYMFVSNNLLTGGIPSSFSALSAMVILDVAKNKLTGTLPDLSLWQNVVDLRLASNNFSGSLPASIGQCTSLTSITAENNYFLSIPSEILTLSLLNNCNFFNNELRHIPAFQNHVNKTNLTLNISRGKLDFAQLESVFNQGIKTLVYSPQKDLDDIVYIQLNEGDTLRIPARASGVNGSITWERWLDGGQGWVNVNSINTDPSQKTFLKPNITLADDGRFRFKLTNTLFPSLVIQSVIMPVRVGKQIVWNNEAGVEDLNDYYIRKIAATGWDNAGAISENQLEANTDGRIEFTASGKTMESSYVLGFTSVANTSLTRTGILNGIELTPALRVLVYESSDVGVDVSNWVLGDILTISREGSTIKYYRNGMLMRSVATDPSLQLKGKVVLHSGESPYSNASFWIPASRGTVPDAWEYKALRDLYDSLQGSQWTRRGSWPTTAPRTVNATAAGLDAWYGVAVSGGDVIRVELQTNNLKGVLPSSISRLQKVNTLRLQSNQLSGRIPSSLGDMTALTLLNLGLNNVSGSIPKSLGKLTNLTWLGLYSTALSGTLPHELFNLTNLESLYLSGTNVEGPIPSDIGKLTKIKVLHLYQNDLSGELPNALFKLTSLTSLALSNNITLNGSLPDSLGNLVNLTELWLNGNDFSESLPQTIGNLNKLKTLNLFKNRFSGKIPASIGNLNLLDWAAFSQNQFTGQIPEGFGNMPLLDSLWLDQNQFTGAIPDTLKKATSLVKLSLSNNKLSGPLPSSLGNLTLLRFLYLGNNDFTGEIPATYSNLAALRQVDFSHTRLSGAIPLTMVSRTALKWMAFNDAEFTSFPNISSRTDKATVTLAVQNNFIPIPQIEVHFTAPNVHGFAQFSYAQQKNPFLKPIYVFELGTSLLIEAPEGGTHGIHLWERLEDGVWGDAEYQDEDPAPHIHYNYMVAGGLSGLYRYRITNSWLGDLDMQSGTFEVQITDQPRAEPIQPLYNGLITSARWRTSKAYEVAGEDLKGMYVYEYDTRYQIQDASWATYTETGFSFAGNQYRIQGMGYDANGNIRFLRRYNGEGIIVNDFIYRYVPNSNKLASIDGYSAYRYNALGQMIGDDKVEEGKEQYIEYDVSGKVVKVFGDSIKTALKIENLYDDRGFRLAKINYTSNRTTWYIRDGSGNVISIYEQDGLPTEENADKVTEVEVPVYGSGKLGMLYPVQDGSMNYELTDHLGNVRALYRDNVNVYTATMEDNLDTIANPRINEMAFFENLSDTEDDNHPLFNVSKPTKEVSSPRMTALLHWNDNPGMQAANKAVGPSIALRVNAGDKLTMEAWTRYEEALSYAREDFDLALLSVLLSNTFVSQYGFEGFSFTQTINSFDNALALTGFNNRDNTENRPFAYINYILYDENMTPVGGNSSRVPETAGSNQAELYIDEEQFKPVKFGFGKTSAIQVSQAGYIYIWLSNESKNTRVWFDDLTVTHTQNMVIQATDYGVWGDVIREQKSDQSLYRYGYQGQYAEKDDETGWSHFELREYDPVIGRWLVPDPYGQFWSPYVAMGNDPVNLTDQDGGCTGPNCPDQTLVNEDPALAAEANAFAEQFPVMGEAPMWLKLARMIEAIDFVADSDIKVTAGLTAKIPLGVTKVDANVISATLFRIQGDLTEGASFTDYLGDGQGLEVTNGFAAEMGAKMEGVDLIMGAGWEQSQRIHMSGSSFVSRNYKSETYYEMFSKKGGSTGLLNKTGNSIKFGKTKDCYCLEIKSEAAFLLGYKATLKLGFK